jgi:3-phosphoshikimate 1-carboxyvinyltransferase
VIELPTDKSIAQRCAILGLDFNKDAIGEDIKSTLKAVKEFSEQNEKIVLDLGNSGTGMRLLTGYIAGTGKECTLKGDASLSSRPMDRIAGPLNNMGANIKLNADRYAPINISKSQLKNNYEFTLNIPSAQIKSCMLLAALTSQSKIEITEMIPSRDHTERILEECGADIMRIKNKIIFDGRKKIQKKFINIPRDFSSAAYFLAANLLTNKSLVLENVGVNPTRIAFLNILEEMGATVSLNNKSIKSNEPRADIMVKCEQELKGVEIYGDKIPNLIDEIPLIGTLAMFATGKTTIRDAKELRYKESDRISLLLSNIKKFNSNIIINEYDDGFDIIPKLNESNDSVEIETQGDHRIAMSFMIASLKDKKKIYIDNKKCVETSFPNFFELLKKWYQ